MIQSLILLAFLTLISHPLSAQNVEEQAPRSGLWRAWLECPGGELPFQMQLEEREGGWHASILNATERLDYSDVKVRESRLMLRLDPYDSWIEATVSEHGQRLTGSWKRNRGSGDQTQMAFHATFGGASRFAEHEESAGNSATQDRSAEIAGRWSVDFDSSDDLSVGIFEAPKTGGIEGTFLTTLGDYRYLEGRVDGARLMLSCFDGAHAFLFTAKLDAKGMLQGNFWSRDSWHETWSAARDTGAKLVDDFELTRWMEGVPLASLTFPDLQGKQRSLDDEAFRGRARIWTLFGSWCPNCGDSTNALVGLHKRYAGQGLSIVGLAFEFEDTDENRRAVVQRYVDKKGVTYPVLIAGPVDKAQASKCFPALDRIRAYPTTVFLDAKGVVRAVHTGFSGPATGATHTRLMERFEDLIEGMLAEQ